jgi:dTDP-4-dehydrorhamnose 3,5-epimerase
MKIIEAAIAGVFRVENTVFEDERGAFSRLFCSDEMQSILGQRSIVQINHSLTRQVGAVRGMHYQKAPQAEMKIIRCLRGRVFDVAVDLRQGSPTFLQWTAVELSPGGRSALVIPEGCAHGFQVLEPHSELLYLHTAFYSPDLEGGVRYDDPRIAISWPLEPRDLSARDRSHPGLDESFLGIPL